MDVSSSEQPWIKEVRLICNGIFSCLKFILFEKFEINLIPFMNTNRDMVMIYRDSLEYALHLKHAATTSQNCCLFDSGSKLDKG